MRGTALGHAIAGVCLLAALLIYVGIRHYTAGLSEGCLRRQSERLAVNAALCFLWPPLVMLLLPEEDLVRGFAAGLVALLVLLCMCLDVKAVSSFLGPLEDYDPGDSISERSKQITTAAFAAGTFLLSSASGGLPASSSSLVFVALLLCVLSAVPSNNLRPGTGEGSTWESVQRSCVSVSGGFLALAIAICVDHKLTAPAVSS